MTERDHKAFTDVARYYRHPPYGLGYPTKGKHRRAKIEEIAKRRGLSDWVREMLLSPTLTAADVERELRLHNECCAEEGAQGV